MKLIILQFPDLARLAKFRQRLGETAFEINLVHLTITGHFPGDLVNEALTVYGARQLSTRSLKT